MTTSIETVLSLKELYEAINSKVYSAKVTYKLSKLFAAVMKESEFYAAQVNKLVNLYGQHDENGQLIFTEDQQGIRVQPDKLNEFQNKMTELLELKIDLPDITFTLDEVGELSLSLQQFNLFLPFINE